MWKIKNLEINSKVVLGPMAGITFRSYREFMSRFGFGVCITEMVSDMGLIYGNEETSTYIDFQKGDYLTGVQLFGHEPENIKKAAEIALKKNNWIDFFDINMGCPVPKVTNTGAGSALMKNPKLCGDIVRAIKEVTDKPVTAKIRLGWDNNSINYLEVIKELEEAGVDMIAIHSRTRKELYAGEPHHELLKGLREKMKVPLVISGNIYSLDDAIRAMEITGADAVMVARGGIGNPYLLKQINEYFTNGNRLENPSLKEQLKWCKELGEMIVEEKGEFTGMRVYRAIAPKFVQGIPNAKKYKVRLCTELTTLDSLNQILKDIAKENDIEF
jgi:tRNA-dihydrouridine synthase B